MYLLHYPVLNGHPDERRLYGTLQHEYYCPLITREAYTQVPDCQSCAVHGTRNRRQKKLPLFPAGGLLEFLALDGSIMKDEIRQPTRDCLPRQIHADDLGHTSHYSNINQRQDRVRPQLVHLVWYTDVPTDR